MVGSEGNRERKIVITIPIYGCLSSFAGFRDSRSTKHTVQPGRHSRSTATTPREPQSRAGIMRREGSRRSHASEHVTRTRSERAYRIIYVALPSCPYFNARPSPSQVRPRLCRHRLVSSPTILSGRGRRPACWRRMKYTPQLRRAAPELPAAPWGHQKSC